jgi:hypothetical protein
MGYAKPVKGLSGVLHGFPIGLAAHDDTDRVTGYGHSRCL